MGLEFVESREGIKVTELNELFEKVCRVFAGSPVPAGIPCRAAAVRRVCHTQIPTRRVEERPEVQSVFHTPTKAALTHNAFIQQS